MVKKKKFTLFKKKRKYKSKRVDYEEPEVEEKKNNKTIIIIVSILFLLLFIHAIIQKFSISTGIYRYKIIASDGHAYYTNEYYHNGDNISFETDNEIIRIYGSFTIIESKKIGGS